jgi:hypothetical protein
MRQLLFRRLVANPDDGLTLMVDAAEGSRAGETSRPI